MLQVSADFNWSVLEQFEISSFEFSPFFIGLSGFSFLNKLHFIYRNNLLSFQIYFQNKAVFLVKRKIFFLLKKLYLFIQSFFLPTIFFTKNYVYGKTVFLYVKHCLGLFLKKTILVFWRYNILIIRLKFQMTYQQAIKTNFGSHYPFYSRLLNYYPYLLAVFILILYHNFNGLLFYGFTNTAFLLQNFLISFQSVVGLTFLVSI